MIRRWQGKKGLTFQGVWGIKAGMNSGDEFDIKEFETLLNLRISQINYFISVYDKNAQTIQRELTPDGKVLLDFPQFSIAEKAAGSAKFGPYEAKKRLTLLYTKYRTTTAKKLRALDTYGKKLSVQGMNFRCDARLIESYNPNYDFRCNVAHISQVVESLSAHVNAFFDRIYAIERFMARRCPRKDEA